MAVRALVFDVFGTLVDWRSGIAQAFQASGVPGDPGELADAWRSRYVPILGEVNEGSRAWANFDALHLVTLDHVLSERGIELDPATRQRLVAAWHQLDPWPDVQAALKTLREGHITATLSNGHIALLVDLARHGNLRFDCVLSAEMAHIYKPAAEVYELAPRLFDLRAEEVMLVAAHPWDLAGARRAGLRTAFVDRPLEYGPGSPSREDPEADQSVGELHQLAARLGGYEI